MGESEKKCVRVREGNNEGKRERATAGERARAREIAKRERAREHAHESDLAITALGGSDCCSDFMPPAPSHARFSFRTNPVDACESERERSMEGAGLVSCTKSLDFEIVFSLPGNLPAASW